MSKFLTHIFYAGEALQPTLKFSDEEEYMPLGKVMGLKFDRSQRFCIGWHDMASGENHSCPENAAIDKKFELCPACQKRTGFNPAFYNTTTISKQQEARNAEPHHLYLAYMGDGYIKVGISWHNRGIRRLLDQGARAGIILETFPTALIARQYEAKIARMEGMHETTTTRTKLSLLAQPFDPTRAARQLLEAKQRIEETTGAHFSGSDILSLDTHYYTHPLPKGTITALDTPVIAGTVQACIGDILISDYDGRLVALPLRQFVGYLVELSDTPTTLNLEPEQMQLF